MKNLWKKFWPYVVTVAGWLLMAGVLVGFEQCIGKSQLKKENEKLREELAKQQQYVPLERDTIRGGVEVVIQKVVEVEKVKEVLSDEDKALLKDVGTKLSAIESYQKIGMRTEAEVTLSRDTVAAYGGGDAANERLPPADSMLTYKDAWLDLKYNTFNQNLLILLRDSLTISVEREYKKKFLWWRWGVKGYEVKAVSFNPYTTIQYNTFVKKKE